MKHKKSTTNLGLHVQQAADHAVHVLRLLGGPERQTDQAFDVLQRGLADGVLLDLEQKGCQQFQTKFQSVKCGSS